MVWFPCKRKKKKKKKEYPVPTSPGGRGKERGDVGRRLPVEGLFQGRELVAPCRFKVGETFASLPLFSRGPGNR